MKTPLGYAWNRARFRALGIATAAIFAGLSGCGEERTALASEAPETVEAPTVSTSIMEVDLSDFSGILSRKSLRVLVPYSAPYFFFEDGEARGITHEMFREYGQFIEKQEDMRSGDLNMVFVPCQLNAIIPWLEAGYGDIAVGGLTVTEARSERVAFSKPLAEGINEILVASDDAPNLTSLDELAGREVWVTAGSSYAEHLQEVSDDMEQRGLSKVIIRVAPATLSTEDLFEMTNAGIIELMVCDSYKADLWSQVLLELKLYEDLAIHKGGSIAWAVRKDNPELLANLNEFRADAKKGTLLGNILIKRYFKTTKWIENPNAAGSSERIERYAEWLRELGTEYDFDWLRLAAQCFQESKLDPDAKSSSGAIGLMQMLPATGKDMGCEDLYDPEENLRAGVRYLDWLRKNYFADPAIEEHDRMDLILAAYNAGPGNVKKWRKLAPSRGLDPNRWRDNIELIAQEKIGIQPIRYVNNIEKIYVAYTLAKGLIDEREELK